MRACILASAICLLTPSAASGQWLPTGEFLIDTAHLNAPGGAEEPAVGFDGTNFLAVWWDERTGDNSLFAARVSPAGQVLDPSGITVAPAGDGWKPAVSFGGTNFLVVYGVDGHIRARRVSPDGEVLEPEIEVTNAVGVQECAKAAFDGTNFLVVWSDWGTSYDIYGARVSPAGAVLDTTAILISDTLGGQSSPAVCHLSSGFLVVWQTQWGDNSIYAARVSGAGVVLDTGGFAVAAPGDEWEPAVAFDGTNALVAWTDYASGADLRGARVTPAGTVLDSAGFLISGAADRQDYAEMVFDGTNYVLVWEDYRNSTSVGDIYAARVTPAAQVLDPNGIAVMSDTFYEQVPVLASGGSLSLVLWTGWPPPDYETDVQMKRVSAGGAVLDSAAVSVATYCPDQWDPVVAFDGANYLVVWEDDRNAPETDIYAARVSPTGQTLDPTGIAVCAEDGWQAYPAVAFDGVNYVIAWEDERDGQPDIYAARVTPAGQLVDTQAIQVAWESGDDERYPTVVAGDTVTLVAWEFERRDIEGRRINRNGQVLDPDIIDISPDERGRYPAAAFDGTDFLVVFEDDRDDTVDIFGTKVGQDGTVLNAEFRISVGDTAEECEPRVAFDGTNYLVVWQTERPGNWEVHATRLTPGCAVLDSPSVTVDQTGRNESDADLDVAFDGADFTVVWEDMRVNPETTDICGARVSTGGQVLERFVAVRQPASQYVPRLARGQGGRLLLVYEGWTTTYQGRPFNTDHIWGKLPPLAGVEAKPGAGARAPKTATIVRGALSLGVDTRQHSANGAELLDISGRKVLELLAGANDVSGLSPGVYFVRERTAVGGERSAFALRKVIVTR